MIHSLRRAYHHTQRFLGDAYREGRKYATHFDNFMNAAGRTVLDCARVRYPYYGVESRLVAWAINRLTRPLSWQDYLADDRTEVVVQWDGGGTSVEDAGKHDTRWGLAVAG